MANELQTLHRALLERYLALQVSGQGNWTADDGTTPIKEIVHPVTSVTYYGTQGLQKLIMEERDLLSRAIIAGV